MSRDKYIAVSSKRKGDKTKFHWDRNCSRLNRAKTVRPATESEVEWFDMELCNLCNSEG